MARISKQDYILMVKTLRPFAYGFESSDGYDLRKFKDWTPGQKGILTRYFNLVRSLSHKPVYVYRPRDPKKLAAVNKALGVEEFPRLKVALIQVAHHGAKVDVSVNKRGIVGMKTPTSSRDIILFSDYGITDEKLALEPEQAVSDVLTQIEDDYSYLTVIAGEFEVGNWEQKSKGVPKFLKPHRMLVEVMKLINAYGADKFDPDNSSSSYFGNWLRGFVGYRFDRHKTFISYTDALIKFKRENEDIKEKIKRAKAQIERWKKEEKRLKSRRRIDPRKKSARLREIEKSINKKRQFIRELIINRVKLSTDR